MAGGAFVGGGLFLASRGAGLSGLIVAGIGAVGGAYGVGATMSNLQAKKDEIRRQYIRCLNNCKKKYPDSCDAAATYFKDNPMK